MNPIELKDMLQYRFLSGLRYAPDHSKAAFAVSVADEEENEYTSCLWMYENGRLRQLTALGKDSYSATRACLANSCMLAAKPRHG